MFSFTKFISLLLVLSTVVSATSTSGHRSRKSSKKFNSNGIGAQFIAVTTTASPVVPTAVVVAPQAAPSSSSSSDSSVAPVAAPTSSAAPAAAAPYSGSYGSGY